jgi:hypothetical protein
MMMATLSSTSQSSSPGTGKRNGFARCLSFFLSLLSFFAFFAFFLSFFFFFFLKDVTEKSGWREWWMGFGDSWAEFGWI